VWYHRQCISGYYLGHLMDGECKIRDEQFGVHNATDRLLYYPGSILADHAGITFLLLAGLVLAGALVVGRFRGRAAPAGAAARGPTLTATSAFVASCFIIPIVFLTLYASPSPVVGGIVVPALVWLVVLAALGLSRLQGQKPEGALWESWATALATLAVMSGLYTFATPLTLRGELTRNRANVEQVLHLYDQIARSSRQCGWNTPRVTCNFLSDYLFPLHIPTLVYERHRFLLPVQMLLGIQIGPVKEAEAIAALRKSDFVIMNKATAAEKGATPFVKSMVQMRSKLLAVCKREFVPLGHFHLHGNEVVLYRRPLVHVSGNTKDRLAVLER